MLRTTLELVVLTTFPVGTSSAQQRQLTDAEKKIITSTYGSRLKDRSTIGSISMAQSDQASGRCARLLLPSRRQELLRRLCRFSDRFGLSNAAERHCRKLSLQNGCRKQFEDE